MSLHEFEKDNQALVDAHYKIHKLESDLARTREQLERSLAFEKQQYAEVRDMWQETEKKLTIAREALEFYANKENWRGPRFFSNGKGPGPWGGDSESTDEYDKDNYRMGMKARIALEKLSTPMPMGEEGR